MEKADIIKEIIRTAEENGGIPLGRDRFHQITSVKLSDWYGKYWAKWNDAIIDAGFEPNQMNQPFDSKYLLEKYSDFINELGKVPTAPEVRMKARNDENFPSHNTFSRFGSKKELVGHLIVFCKKHSKYNHLVSLLESAPHASPSEAQENDKKTNDQTAYVYLMQFGNEYKIGNSLNVERRFRELKTQMPYEGKIIHTIETGDPEGIEAYWHAFFSDKRLKGEWFNLSISDIKYFKKRKLM